MQQSMVGILYINKKEDRGSEGVQDGKRNLASSARCCRTLAKSRMRREIEELSALLQSLEDEGGGEEDLWRSVISCRALRVPQTEQETWEHDENLVSKNNGRIQRAAAEP